MRNLGKKMKKKKGDEIKERKVLFLKNPQTKKQ